MKIFLTGGTGFIGSEVARRLRDRGDEVRVLVRNPATSVALERVGCRLIAGDLSNLTAIRNGMKGCNAVIHGAALYQIGIPKSRRAEMYQANVGGTEIVLSAALELKIDKVVYASTVNAFGNTRGRVVDESHLHDESYLSYYDETKHLAHKVAKQMIEKGLPCVIVQPGAVYGPGRSVASGQRHQPVPGRAAAGDGVPGDRDQPGPSRRHRQRRPSGPGHRPRR